MEQRTYTFNQSTLTVKFGNILDSQAEVIASSDIDQIDFRNPIASSRKLITSLMYVLNK